MTMQGSALTNILQTFSTLISGTVPSGRHAVAWDGRDNRGRSLSSGVYFYRLHGGRETLTRKLVRLR